MGIQGPQDRSGISTAATQTRLTGNSLGDTDFQALRVLIHSVAIELCGLPCQIPLIGGDTLGIAFQAPGLAGTHIDFNIIPQGNSLHNTAQVMIAILPLAKHIQRQIDLGIGRFKQCRHLILRPSR